jgi:hypothetical protein
MPPALTQKGLEQWQGHRKKKAKAATVAAAADVEVRIVGEAETGATETA